MDKIRYLKKYVMILKKKSSIFGQNDLQNNSAFKKIMQTRLSIFFCLDPGGDFQHARLLNYLCFV